VEQRIRSHFREPAYCGPFDRRATAWTLLRGDPGGNLEISMARLAQSANSPLYIMSFSGNLTDR